MAWWKRSLIPDTHTDTHTHGIKAVWTARAPALARTWPPARTINYFYNIHLGINTLLSPKAREQRRILGKFCVPSACVHEGRRTRQMAADIHMHEVKKGILQFSTVCLSEGQESAFLRSWLSTVCIGSSPSRKQILVCVSPEPLCGSWETQTSIRWLRRAGIGLSHANTMVLETTRFYTPLLSGR